MSGSLSYSGSMAASYLVIWKVECHDHQVANTPALYLGGPNPETGCL